MKSLIIAGIGIIVLILMLALAAPEPVSAQGTATPLPTSTFVWQTPTPWPTVDPAATLGFASETFATDLSQTIINGYRFVNQQGVVDFVIFVCMTALIVGLLIRFVRRAQENRG